VKVRHALTEAERRLAAIPGQPRQDAELLMAHALGTSVGASSTCATSTTRHPPEFARALDRRLAREPIAYITGRAGFWTIELEVGPGVLIPRADSETLIAAAQEHFGTRAPATILDLGTGPGTLLLAALDQWPSRAGWGSIARQRAGLCPRNASAWSRSARELRRGDWGEGSRASSTSSCATRPTSRKASTAAGRRAWEPHGALFAGPTAGRLSPPRPDLPRLLAPEGIACIEVGEVRRAPSPRCSRTRRSRYRHARTLGSGALPGAAGLTWANAFALGLSRSRG
jgi:release factor glutamine methyltransferase